MSASFSNTEISSAIIRAIHYESFLGAFPGLRKSTISFVMSCQSVPLSVRPLGTTQLSLEEFSWNLISGTFRRPVQKTEVPLNSDKNNGHFTRRPRYVYDISRELFLVWGMFQTKVVENIKNTSFMFGIFYSANRAMENVTEQDRPQMAV
jgi:hypothetical protein